MKCYAWFRERDGLINNSLLRNLQQQDFKKLLLEISIYVNFKVRTSNYQLTIDAGVGHTRK